ncbi:tripartite motif-containing protein 43-like [Perognathus longimembris pacificus]|uniref:tripartite motif-containing protein 43-like n=1 Tax=Perognathus longimembris pacificus TaxID=214514 RepID=UPI0020191BF3|nr:tripartite motif-containing protein 43-like [Perognathus longimembris pacificus]
MDWVAAQACQKELSCVICMSTFLDPVTTACGHSFCRPCLCLAWEATQGPASCPICREPAQQRDLVTNVVLKGLAAIARRAGLRRFLRSEEGTCGTHGEPRQNFCEVDKDLLCGRCSGSREHEAHRHHPVERAVEEQRETILKQMRAVWEKVQENRAEIAEQRGTIDQWISYVNLHRGMASDVFAVLHLASPEEERWYSETLLHEGSVILLHLRATETQMLRYGRHLRETYQELMRTYQMAEGDLLREAESTLESCEALLACMPRRLMPQLRAPQAGRAEGDHADALWNSEGWANSTAFGSRVFSSGQHYWELSGNDSATWAAGVCRDSAIGSHAPMSQSGDLFLLLCVKGNTHYTLFTTSPVLPHYVERPLGRVGVLLDLDNGSVSFWNVAKRSLIWRYPNGSFQFPVRPLLHGAVSGS